MPPAFVLTIRPLESARRAIRARLRTSATCRRSSSALLFRAVPHDYKLKHLRDCGLLGLLGVQALRTVEIRRANVTDLQRHGESWALLVHWQV